MRDITKALDSLVKEASEIFNREGDAHAPRPDGIIVLGDLYVSETITAMKRNEILKNVPITTGPRLSNGAWYSVDTNQLFKEYQSA